MGVWVGAGRLRSATADDASMSAHSVKGRDAIDLDPGALPQECRAEARPCRQRVVESLPVYAVHRVEVSLSTNSICALTTLLSEEPAAWRIACRLSIAWLNSASKPPLTKSPVLGSRPI